MCYDAVSAARSILKYAVHRGESPESIEELQRELEQLEILFNEPKYYVSGFSHPKLLVFTNEKPFTPQAFTWGLIPEWVKEKKQALQLANQTLNARVESIFEKPSYRSSARHKRCLVYLDAFYEHFHQGGKTFPFHISMKDESPLAVAGLWSEWVNKETGEIISTVSIVTTRGNEIMQRIHNNPKAEGPRMPLILPKEMQNEWLIPFEGDQTKIRLMQLAEPFDASLMKAHPVKRLKGKEAIGNIPEAEEKFAYPDIDY
ncbi:MAG TPA: SOS response-associated peptidase [Bacteroidia bacterium]|nr:SOS response-associated peptidase [Bacteroidia bacterium]